MISGPQGFYDVTFIQSPWVCVEVVIAENGRVLRLPPLKVAFATSIRLVTAFGEIVDSVSQAFRDSPMDQDLVEAADFLSYMLDSHMLRPDDLFICNGPTEYPKLLNGQEDTTLHMVDGWMDEDYTCQDALDEGGAIAGDGLFLVFPLGGVALHDYPMDELFLFVGLASLSSQFEVITWDFNTQHRASCPVLIY